MKRLHDVLLAVAETGATLAIMLTLASLLLGSRADAFVIALLDVPVLPTVIGLLMALALPCWIAALRLEYRLWHQAMLDEMRRMARCRRFDTWHDPELVRELAEKACKHTN